EEDDIDLDNVNDDDSDTVSKLLETRRYLDIMQKVEDALEKKGSDMSNSSGIVLQDYQLIVDCTALTSTPPSLRMRACRLLAGKSILAARIDSVNGHPTGNKGRALRDKIHKTIEKWQEPPPAKRPKPLLVPDDCKPKKKRGGRRLRRMKQRYAITDMRKMAGRIQFGVAEETYLGDGLGEGYGMLGQALRVSVAKSKLAAKLAKK
ncbi:hypothetical protein C3L33_04169, partial [Rhododendron williamsianum]